MLALLRVAPLLPSPTLRAAATGPQVGTGKQAHWIELQSSVWVTLIKRVPRIHGRPPIRL